MENDNPCLRLMDWERDEGFVRPLRSEYRHTACGAVTSMIDIDMARAYAKNPQIHAVIFCAPCQTCYPISEFAWIDGTEVGS